jgi:hypothetical protein
MEMIGYLVSDLMTKYITFNERFFFIGVKLTQMVERTFCGWMN